MGRVLQEGPTGRLRVPRNSEGARQAAGGPSGTLVNPGPGPCCGVGGVGASAPNFYGATNNRLTRVGAQRRKGGLIQREGRGRTLEEPRIDLDDDGDRRIKIFMAGLV